MLGGLAGPIVDKAVSFTSAQCPEEVMESPRILGSWLSKESPEISAAWKALLIFKKDTGLNSHFSKTLGFYLEFGYESREWKDSQNHSDSNAHQHGTQGLKGWILFDLK